MTKCQNDVEPAATDSEAETSGAAFMALRPRARAMFLAYVQLEKPTCQAAADACGYSYSHSRDLFNSDPFQAALDEWQLSLHREVRSALKAAAVKAVGALVKRIDSEDDDVAIRASTAVLDRGGHAPKQEIDMRADVKTTRTDNVPTEELEAQLAAAMGVKVTP